MGLGVATRGRLSLRGERQPKGTSWVLERVVLFTGLTITLAFLVKTALEHRLAFDLTHAYVGAARDVLHGVTPYHAAALHTNEAFVYPPLAAFLAVPLSLLPGIAIQVLGTLLTVAAVLGALWLLGVRDWRCFVAVIGSSPLFSVAQTCNLIAVVALFAAASWRFRGRPIVCGVLVAVAVALKLVAWRLLLFLPLTRRFRATAVATAGTVVAIVGPWAAIGFAGFTGYPHFLSASVQGQEPDAYTLAALVARSLSWNAAHAVTLAVGAVVVAFMIRSGRDDQVLFVAALALALLLSPLVWVDYFVFVFVALAAARSEFGLAWKLPLALWLVPAAGRASVAQVIFALVLVFGVLAAAARDEPVRERPLSAVTYA